MLLGVNIDHVATLRNARGGCEPDPVAAAAVCEENGANSITAHLREDRRHIKDEDILALSQTLKTSLNLEMAINSEIREIALKVKPKSICLVPERRQEITTEGGLDAAGKFDEITEFVRPLVDTGILVSLFIDPDIKQVRAAVNTGAQFIELHTGAYSEAFGTGEEENEFQKLKMAAMLGQSLGLKVNAGHGLNYQNVCRMHEINGLVELNIGHSIISRAVFTGLGNAVKDMAGLVNGV
ncbi:MAG: pyridoxine 5'-phosphate synthase [Heliobacteriaceae bacterium]|nr:pyridoxine 5'-phosphate synthase [Heliobacteriaceae bacterium]